MRWQSSNIEVRHRKQRHCAECQQLDDGFERNREHHAFVMFRGIQATSSEQRGEHCHQHRNVQRRIAIPRAERIGCPRDNRDTAGNGLVLQGQVRQPCSECHQRDDRRNFRALPESGRDQV